jgi:squalene cyclase
MGRTDALETVSTGVDVKGLDETLRAGRRRLWQAQAADGSWTAACDMGPASTAYVVTALAFTRRLSAATGREASRFLRSQQNPDGSMRGQPFGSTGDLGATAALWAALWSADPTGNTEAIERARGFIERNGGMEALVDLFYEGDPAAVFLAMAGLLPRAQREAVTPPILTTITPGVSRLMRKVSVILPWRALAFGVILRSLERPSRNPITRVAVEHERTVCLESLDRTANADGSWLYGDTLHASLAMAALHAMGRSDDPRLTFALSWLENQKESDDQGLRYKIFQADVWTTAFDLRALMASGAHASRLGLMRATRWLMDCQRHGSWAFQQKNTSMPDCDDVGIVLATLANARTHGASTKAWRALDARLGSAITDAIAWLRKMQNPDGGWPSFQHGLPSKAPGAIMTKPLSLRPIWMRVLLVLDPPAEAGDPATEDVTGRVLHGLGQSGLRVNDPMVARAVQFLREQQCLNGAFWGRWVVNYLASTAWVLRGAIAVGVPTHEGWIRRAIDFIKSHQRADGGWGEDVNSYRDPMAAGEGSQSTAGLTGLVLSALVEVGESRSYEAARAAAYLQKAQNADGSWPNGNLVHALVPPTLFYTLPGAELQLPLEGLGLFASANHIGERSSASIDELAIRRRRTVADFRQRLEAARNETDKAADAAVVAIQRSGLQNVAPLIMQITRTRDLVPSALPEPVAVMFENPTLPSWADPVRMKQAQQLFERCGWAAALSLFASSLPQCYACAEGAKILMHTEELRRNPQRRILETAQFVFDITASNAFSPNGRGFRSATKVRILHALIRSLVRQKLDIWNPRAGEPISQFYLIGTLMTFSVVVVDGMRTMELQVDDTDADAWVHLWNVVGYLMGISEDLLPVDAREAESLLEAVREMSWAPSEGGAQLARATLGVMQDQLLPGRALDGFAVMLVRHLAGDRCADLLGLPPSNWTEALFAPMSAAMDLFEVSGASPLAVVMRRASMQLMKGLHKAYLGSGRPEYETLESTLLLQKWQEAAKGK